MKNAKSFAKQLYMQIFVLSFFPTKSITQDTFTATKNVNDSEIFYSYESVMVIGIPDSFHLNSFYKKYSDAFAYLLRLLGLHGIL